MWDKAGWGKRLIEPRCSWWAAGWEVSGRLGLRGQDVDRLEPKCLESL
ncbi:hypothetical protein [Bartonella mastomydis]|nr:hypothetical protein [Bartonella mastomydis]